MLRGGELVVVISFWIDPTACILIDYLDKLFCKETAPFLEY
jgi:hypothetical protein